MILAEGGDADADAEADVDWSRPEQVQQRTAGNLNAQECRGTGRLASLITHD